MSLARAIVRLSAAAVPDPGAHARYQEQWLADLDGAAEVGLPVLPLALGTVVAAARIAMATPRAVVLLPRVGGGLRRAYGAVQLLAAAPYLWALAEYVNLQVRTGGTDPSPQFGDHPEVTTILGYLAPVMNALGPMKPFAERLEYLPAMAGTVWLAFGGWVIAAGLAPAGLLLAIGGRRWARRLPAIGTATAAVAVWLTHSAFGQGLTMWLLD